MSVSKPFFNKLIELFNYPTIQFQQWKWSHIWKMLIQDISRFRQFLPLSIFRDLIKTLSCYIFCKLNYSKLRQSLWVTKLTRKSPPHSCKQCNTSSWLVPPPLNTLEQAMFIKSSTEKKKRKWQQFFVFLNKEYVRRTWWQKAHRTKRITTVIGWQAMWVTNSSLEHCVWAGSHPQGPKPSQPWVRQTGRKADLATQEFLLGTSARCWYVWTSQKYKGHKHNTYIDNEEK